MIGTSAPGPEPKPRHTRYDSRLTLRKAVWLWVSFMILMNSGDLFMNAYVYGNTPGFHHSTVQTVLIASAEGMFVFIVTVSTYWIVSAKHQMQNKAFIER